MLRNDGQRGYPTGMIRMLVSDQQRIDLTGFDIESSEPSAYVLEGESAIDQHQLAIHLYQRTVATTATTERGKTCT